MSIGDPSIPAIPPQMGGVESQQNDLQKLQEIISNVLDSCEDPFDRESVKLAVAEKITEIEDSDPNKPLNIFKNCALVGPYASLCPNTKSFLEVLTTRKKFQDTLKPITTLKEISDYFFSSLPTGVPLSPSAGKQPFELGPAPANAPLPASQNPNITRFKILT